MKKLLLLFTLGLFIMSCGGDTKNTMTVSGKVKGLKKGTLYLQHFTDSLVINIDSLQVDGEGSFSFKTEVNSPEVFHLHLKKEDFNDYNDRITFFGEAGNIIINTTWDSFDRDAEITGSAINDVYVDYRKNMSKFNIKSIAIAQQARGITDSLALDSIQKLSNSNIRRTYAYALNFALNNKNSTIAPYVVVTDVPDANKMYLDSIYNSLSVEASSSKYGVALKKLIKK